MSAEPADDIYLQTAIDAVRRAGEIQRQASRGAADSALASLKQAGMTVTELPPAELAKLREKVKPVIDKYTATVGEATVKELNAEIAKVRK